MNTLKNRSRRGWRVVRLAVAGLTLLLGGRMLAQDAALPPGLRGFEPPPPLAAGRRDEAVERARRQAERMRGAALEEAARRGLPARVEGPDGRVIELVGWTPAGPLYFTTLNVNAAISTASNLIRPEPYYAEGAGTTIGIWDGGAVRPTHVEFGGRVTVQDDAAHINHATHVGGTIGAAGVDALARGMASAVWIDSYDWIDDSAEMWSRGASAPDEAGTLAISNHSYGMTSGWDANRQVWYGSGTDASAYEPRFGQYNAFSNEVGARDADDMAHSLPYYLMFWAAGNDRSQNPATGSSVELSPDGPSAIYDPALHPPGDGVYRGGYDTISFRGVSKNVVTVGAVNDAVTSGQRDLGKATMTAFSSWGPTDDGRIKPDLVANGVVLRSTLGGSDTQYGNMSGTSMASPNAAGTAQQLVAYFGSLFPGGAMRASTLKGLLVHTADFLGADPGPNYRTGWGLINAKAAADLILSVATEPTVPRMIEQQITPAVPTRIHRFDWDGASPIRATLCWTDPPGPSTTLHDNRTRRLVNDLNLHLVDPEGGVHLPWVMPFVTSNFDLGQLSTPAATGTNRTDNVVQADLFAPALAGTYEAVVTYSGTLLNNQQVYSLLLSGSAAVPPEVQAVSPDSIPRAAGIELLVLGDNFAPGATAALVRDGHPDLPLQITFLAGDEIRGLVDSSGIATGLWDVRVVNPDDKAGLLQDALAVVWELFEQGFDDGAPGWSTYLTTGSGDSGWALTDAVSHTPTHSYGIVPPAAKRTDNLESEGIPVPATARALELRFWHRFNLEPYDGGKLQLRLNNGSWVDAASSGSGSAFVQGGYTATVANRIGAPSNRSEFGGQLAWTGAEVPDFSEVVLSLDHAVFAGQTLGVRWRLATDATNGGGDWYWNVDTPSVTGFDTVNHAPFIVVPAAADPSPVTGTATTLSVIADDDGGASALVYTWSVAEGPVGAVQFAVNGSNAARETVATFAEPGEYVLAVLVEDVELLSVGDAVAVTAERTPTTLVVLPAAAEVGTGADQPFTAEARDQFDEPYDPPPVFLWAVAGGGSIDAEGLFTAGMTPGGPHAVTASALELLGTAWITVTEPPAPTLILLR